MEASTGDQRIGDLWEGVNQYRHEGRVPTLDEAGGKEFHEKLANNIGVSVGGGNNNVISADLHSIQSEDLFVYCLSMSDETELGGAGATYDACVKVMDITELTKTISKYGQLESGEPIGSFISGLGWGPVEYTATLQSIDTNFERGNPLRKRSSYAYQKECRLILKPQLSPTTIDGFKVLCPQAAYLLSDHKSIDIPASPDLALDTQDYREMLRDIIEEYQNITDAFVRAQEASIPEIRALPDECRQDGIMRIRDRNIAPQRSFEAANRIRVCKCLWELRKTRKMKDVDALVSLELPFFLIVNAVKESGILERD